MAKKRTSEKSERSVISPPPGLPQPSSFWRAGILLAALLSITTAGFFGQRVFSNAAPLAGRTSKSANPPAEYYLAGPAEARMGKGLVAGAGETTFDLRDELAAWKKQRWFSYAGLEKNFVPQRTSLNTAVFRRLGLTDPWRAFGEKDRVWGFDLDEEKIYAYLSGQLGTDFEMAAQSAKLVIQNGRATEFVPDRPGLTADTRLGISVIKTALFSGQTMTDLPLVVTQPSIRLADVNDLGITGLVAQGVSDFSGSSASRIHNIRTGAGKFQGLILKPGEEFSFTNHLGPVTAEAGFLPELVIKTKETVPELGGGLCQVSTTVFRAALYGGLQITARRNHSYAVKYYSPQGTDATIYPGAVDFKFINDTPGYLLIGSRIVGTKLYFEFYGTPDGRKVAIDGPYTYDRKPDGSMKARLTRTVSLNGAETAETFISRYVSKDLFPTQYIYPQTPASPTSPTPPPVPPTSDPATTVSPPATSPEPPAAIPAEPNNTSPTIPGQ